MSRFNTEEWQAGQDRSDAERARRAHTAQAIDLAAILPPNPDVYEVGHYARTISVIRSTIVRVRDQSTHPASLPGRDWKDYDIALWCIDLSRHLEAKAATINRRLS